MAHSKDTLLALFRLKVFPLLEEAGFEGNAARCVRGAGTAGVIATATVPRNAKDPAGELRVTISPVWSGPFYVHEHIRAMPTQRDAAIQKLITAVRKAIRKIGSIPPAKEAAPSLDAALRSLLTAMPRARWKPRLSPLRIQRVEEKRRQLSVVHAGRKRPSVADRTTLLTLMRELWGEPFVRGVQDPRFELSYTLEEELADYVAQLRLQSEEEAQAVFVHFWGSATGEHPNLRRLFAKRPAVGKILDEASSGGALVRRAIPYARKGRLVERVAAIHSLNTALNDAWRHRDAEGILESVRDLASELAEEEAPLLRECGWLFGPMLDWCEQRRRRASR
jgi:hypothetical protein